MSRSAIAASDLAAVDWLARACRAYLVPDGAGPPLACDVPPADLQRLAPAHELEPVLHALAVSGAFAGEVPEALRESWLAAYCLTLLRNRRRLAGLDRINARCEARGLALLALKGPVHIARLYGDPGLRPMIDLDLLCRADELAGVCEVLRECGYRAIRESAGYHLELHHAETGDRIELHFDVYPEFADRGEFTARLFEGAEVCELQGYRIPAPSRECGLVFDLGHLVHHDLRVGLRPLLDFALQLRALPAPDPARVQALLGATDLQAEYGRSRALLTGLGWLVGPRPEGETAERPLVRQLRLAWAELPEQAGGTPALTEAAYRPGIAGKLAQVVGVVFPPSQRLADSSGVDATAWLRARHAFTTVGRGLRSLARARWRSAPTISLKRELHRRRWSR